MTDLVDNGFTEKVAAKDIGVQSGHEWYLPRYGVYHPRKPQKLRVVFDGSARYMPRSRGVMVIVVGNGHGDTSSNPRQD